LRAVAPESPDPSGPGAAVAGAFAVFELFKARTGFRLPETSGRLCVLDQETLESRTHPVPPATGCPNCREALARTRGRPRPGAEALSPRDLVVRVKDRLTSDVSGVFGAFGEAELAQVPLNQCAATVAVPGMRPRKVVEVGATPLDARMAAIVAGIETYCALGARPSRPPGPGCVSAYGCATDPAEAQFRAALIAVARAAVVGAAPAEWSAWPDAADAAPDLVGYLRTLGVVPTVDRARVGAAHLVRAAAGDDRPVIAAGLDPTGTVRRALARLVQRGVNPAGTPGPDLDGHVTADAAASTPTGREWTTLARSLRRTGYDVVATRCDLRELDAVPQLHVARVTLRFRSQAPAAPSGSAGTAPVTVAVTPATEERR
jgi:hypothetical protein